jgi:hypothetical protein
VLTEEELGWMDSNREVEKPATHHPVSVHPHGRGGNDGDHALLPSAVGHWTRRRLEGSSGGGYWSIENRLYWFLGVCFGEDDCRARTNHAAENLNVLRKTALYLLWKTSIPEKRFSLSRKMLKTTLSDDFLHDVLFGKVK